MAWQRILWVIWAAATAILAAEPALSIPEVSSEEVAKKAALGVIARHEAALPRDWQLMEYRIWNGVLALPPTGAFAAHTNRSEMTTVLSCRFGFKNAPFLSALIFDSADAAAHYHAFARQEVAAQPVEAVAGLGDTAELFTFRNRRNPKDDIFDLHARQGRVMIQGRYMGAPFEVMTNAAGLLLSSLAEAQDPQKHPALPPNLAALPGVFFVDATAAAFERRARDAGWEISHKAIERPPHPPSELPFTLSARNLAQERLENTNSSPRQLRFDLYRCALERRGETTLLSIAFYYGADTVAASEFKRLESDLKKNSAPFSRLFQLGEEALFFPAGPDVRPEDAITLNIRQERAILRVNGTLTAGEELGKIFADAIREARGLPAKRAPERPILILPNRRAAPPAKPLHAPEEL